MEERSFLDSHAKFYRVYFTNGTYVDIKADDDEYEDGRLVLFNGDNPEKEEVAIFMMNNISGFSTIHGVTKYWASNDGNEPINYIIKEGEK